MGQVWRFLTFSSLCHVVGERKFGGEKSQCKCHNYNQSVEEHGHGNLDWKMICEGAAKKGKIQENFLAALQPEGHGPEQCFGEQCFGGWGGAEEEKKVECSAACIHNLEDLHWHHGCQRWEKKMHAIFRHQGF